MTKKRMLLVFALIIAVLAGCGKSSKKQYASAKNITSFRNVPGVTREEINAIEAIQKKYSSFVYGMSPSTEAFIGENGEIQGYSALFCGWLTEMFGKYFL